MYVSISHRYFVLKLIFSEESNIYVYIEIMSCYEFELLIIYFYIFKPGTPKLRTKYF